MTLHEVTMWTVKCDHPGCDRSTQSLGEHSGWEQRWYAAEEWTDAGGVVIDDGTAWCEDHVPAQTCRESSDYEHRWEPDEERTDALCSMEVALVAVACSECGAERDDGRRCPCDGTGWVNAGDGAVKECTGCRRTGWTLTDDDQETP